MNKVPKHIQGNFKRYISTDCKRSHSIKTNKPLRASGERATGVTLSKREERAERAEGAKTATNQQRSNTKPTVCNGK